MAVSIQTSLVLAAAAGLALAIGAAASAPPASAQTPAAPTGAASTPAAPSLCATGGRQSPVDLGSAIDAVPPAIRFNWAPSHGATITNTGRTLEADLQDAGEVETDGRHYALKRLQFRSPSEHTVDGRSFPLELQLVHEEPTGAALLVSVLLEDGPAMTALDPIWATTPARPGAARVQFDIDPERLLPAERSFYRYEGSATSPPCEENAIWIVMTATASASRAQIEAFRQVFPANARPVQPLNRRYILRSMTEAAAETVARETPSTQPRRLAAPGRMVHKGP